MEIYNAAKNGNLELVMDLHQKGGSIVMALMGASESSAPESKKCLKYALDNDAPVLFSIQQPKIEIQRGSSFFTRVKRVGGWGEA